MEQNNDTPVLRRVRRFDSTPMSPSYFTKEGYLIDHPILTSTGIFEYKNPDGSTRRELRLPEDVFEEESLNSYKGAPIILTHSGGNITKDNVADHQIGTILSKGYRDGEDVRAEIVIHDTDTMRQSGLKELSLGYNLDLVEEPGKYKGEPYDAIQKNIRINHLALVGTARAGDKARLNIDSRDGEDIETLKGGKAVAHNEQRLDEKTMTLIELKDAINKLIQQFGDETGAAPEGKEEAPAAPTAPEGAAPKAAPAPTTPAPVPAKPEKDAADEDPTIGIPAEGDKEKKALKAAAPAPAMPQAQPKAPAAAPAPKAAPAPQAAEEDPDEPQPASIPTRKDGGIEELIAALEEVLARFRGGENADADEDEEAVAVPIQEDASDEEPEFDFDYTQDPTEDPLAEEGNEDSATGDNLAQNKSRALNTDSIDDLVAQKLSVLRLGDRLNMTGLESMSTENGKKAIITKVLPKMNLDGQTPAYIDAAFSIVSDMVGERKDANFQKRQMAAGVVTHNMRIDGTSKNMAMSARERMIAEMSNETEEGGNE